MSNLPPQGHDPRLVGLASADPTEVPEPWRDLLEGPRTSRKGYTTMMASIGVAATIGMVIAAVVTGGDQVWGFMLAPGLAVMMGFIVLNGWPKKPGVAPSRSVVIDSVPATQFTRRLATVVLGRLMWVLPIAVLVLFGAVVVLTQWWRRTAPTSILAGVVTVVVTAAVTVITARDQRARTLVLDAHGVRVGRKAPVAWSDLARVDLVQVEVRGRGRAIMINEAGLCLVSTGGSPITVHCEDFEQHPIALLAALRFYWTNPPLRHELGTPVADQRIAAWTQRAEQNAPLS